MHDSETGRTGRPTDDPISQELRERLRTARRDRGMSIYDLAARIGKTPSFVSLLENGKQVPDVETITRIAKALRLDERLLRAWVDVRKSRDATRAVEAAHELVELLPQQAGMGRSQSLSRRMREEQVEAFASAGQLVGAAMPAVPAIEEIRTDQIRVPVVAVGTEPGHPDEQRSHPRRPLWLDRRLLPPVQELREPFAFRVGRESGRRVRGLILRGDYAVISRERDLGPERISPRMVYAVRLKEMVVLSRADHVDGKLLLLPAGEAGGVEMLDAGKPGALGKLIAGRVVAVLRAFGREEGAAPVPRRRGHRS